ncbi:MAG: enoyl-CoA hydratase [Deltaproteobacteria bacterium]|nr:enoyl-CoA hydratase [Deltaproteobacteria bacterium]
MDELKVEVRNRVGILTLNRPDKLNALTRTMGDSAVVTLKEWAESPDVGAVIVTGAGRGFCAGGDVSAMDRGTEMGVKGATLEQKVDSLRERQSWPWLLYSIPKVTIAVVNGPAAGAGLGLAMSCDLRIASDQARFGTAYARVGYGGDYGATWQLTRLVGQAKAKELFFLPDMITATEAQQLNLVNRVFPHEKLWEEAIVIAERIASGPLMSYRYMKANINASMNVDFRTMLDREAETHVRCGETEDHREGVRAFMEKRQPVFRGR